MSRRVLLPVSSSLAAIRASVGGDLTCADSDVNAADFAASTPAPHGAANACACF